MDRRPEELRHLSEVSNFLSNTYPELFENSEYTHPVKGVCKTLIIKIPDKNEVDLTRINQVSIDFINNVIQIELNSPSAVINIRNFIKDKTVM